MFGVPLNGPTNVFCDNQSVVNNSSQFASTLNKKHSFIAYHSVRWAITADIIHIAWTNTNINLAASITFCLPVEKRNHLFGE